MLYKKKGFEMTTTETDIEKGKGTPVLVLIVVSLFVSIASTALSAGYLSGGEFTSGLTWMLVAVMGAQVCSTVSIMSAIGKVGE